MKKLIILLSFIFIINETKAQYVTIPDANFVAYLQANFPSCMSGNQMDTTCAGITGTTLVNVANDSIFDLTGIQYFDNLQILYCYQNYLSSLPTLPNTLIHIECDRNHLITLPTIPNNLQFLRCSKNLLTSLPQLPNSLTAIDCGYNQLANLPTLPNFLIGLGCSNNQITNLPALPGTLQQLTCNSNQLSSLPVLPSSLIQLNCDSNQITVIPPLPNTIAWLTCNANLLTSLPAIPNNPLAQVLLCCYNQLTSLPSLPNSLIVFGCNYNQISSLPPIPDSLHAFYCSNNLLTSIPVLQNSIIDMDCSFNQITSIPNLSTSLTWFICNNNNIDCFPTFPVSLTNTSGFDISNNPFTCLPNYVAGMDAGTLAYPLCVTGDLVNNPNGCDGAVGIVGFTYQDSNSNCLKDSTDIGLKNIHEKLYNNSSLLISQTFSALNGVYDFPEPLGTYTVKIDTTDLPIMVQCVYPGIDTTVVLSSANPLIYNVDYSLTCKPGFDVGTRSITLGGVCFPSLAHKVKINAGDMSQWYNLHCATGIGGQVVVTVTGPVTYYGVASGALTPAIAGNIYTYNIADFGTINNLTSFGLVFTTNTTAVSGNTVCVNVVVTPVGDNDTINNNFNFCYNVVNSYDPNYKETYPDSVSVGFNDYFTYTIHFQNTGTAPAINVKLKDTLSSSLDLSTFQMINYSHPCTTHLNNNKVLFDFQNINLPDSTSDSDGSQGFVQYRIKPIAGLPGGTQIHNRASIYFDYNSPIVTNTTVNQIGSNLGGINENVNENTLSIYPNPTNGKFTIFLRQAQDDGLKLKLEITNVLGEIVRSRELGVRSSNVEVDLSGEPKGIYFVRIIGGAQSLNQRIMNR